MTYEQLFDAELALAGAARYLRHLSRITGELSYADALVLVLESLEEIDLNRKRKLRRKAA
jgi:hypothetical protein